MAKRPKRAPRSQVSVATFEQLADGDPPRVWWEPGKGLSVLLREPEVQRYDAACEWPACQLSATVRHFHAWDQTEHFFCTDHSVDHQIGLMHLPPDCPVDDLRATLLSHFRQVEAANG